MRAAARRDRVAVPVTTQRALVRARDVCGGVRPLSERLTVAETTVWDALAPVAIVRPVALERLQAGLRAMGEEP